MRKHDHEILECRKLLQRPRIRIKMIQQPQSPSYRVSRNRILIPYSEPSDLFLFPTHRLSTSSEVSNLRSLPIDSQQFNVEDQRSPARDDRWISTFTIGIITSISSIPDIRSEVHRNSRGLTEWLLILPFLQDSFEAPLHPIPWWLCLHQLSFEMVCLQSIESMGSWCTTLARRIEFVAIDKSPNIVNAHSISLLGEVLLVTFLHHQLNSPEIKCTRISSLVTPIRQIWFCPRYETHKFELRGISPNYGNLRKYKNNCGWNNFIFHFQSMGLM